MPRAGIGFWKAVWLLIASQLLTLLTTPVVYMLLDKLRRRKGDERHLSRASTEPT